MAIIIRHSCEHKEIQENSLPIKEQRGLHPHAHLPHAKDAMEMDAALGGCQGLQEDGLV